MDRRDGEPERLKALVEGRDWAPMGTSPAEKASPETADHPTEPIESGRKGT
jgi:hypothetical protein